MRKNLDENEGHSNSERWLLTYSDMITLLLALFIIMYGMSTENQEKLKEVSAALSKAFNIDQSQVSGDADVDLEDIDWSQLGTGTGGGQSTENPLENIYNQMNEYMISQDLADEMDLEINDHSISIRLKDRLLFKGNSAELASGSEAILEKVSGVIMKVYDDVNHITITGNTADLGNRDVLNEADAWQLSVDRAVRVLNALTADGLSPEKLSIEGNSHYNPVASNDTPEGRAANRRVDITITDGAN